MTKQMSIVTRISTILVALVLGIGSAFAQNQSIVGTVVDAQGEAVIGASVIVVGNSTIGTVTDIDGKFTLSVPAGANVEVSCIGYKSQTLSTANKSVFSIVLEEDTLFLEETVVIGYGVQKKSDLTGSVGSLRGDELKKQSTTDAAAALQGKVAGVYVITDGAPGSGANIRVRGTSSNSGNLSPLFIVDGLKVSSIQYLDPSMIESMEVLKDAASAAIYGAEAGNGVVLVTTKKGETGTASVTYSGKAMMQNYTRRPLMNRSQFLEWMELEGYDVKGNLEAFDYKHPMYDGGVIDTDWIGAYIEPTWSHQHSLSFQGGNNKGHFFTSINYVYDDGVVKGKKDVYKRLTAQVNADYQLFKWLQVGTNNSIEKWDTQGVSQRGYSSSFETMWMMDPITPVYWTKPEEMSNGAYSRWKAVQDGTSAVPYNFLGDENGFFANTKYADTEGNPLAKRDATDSSNGGINVNGTLYANLMPVKGLTITSRFGYRINASASHSYTAPYCFGDRGNNDNYSISASTNYGYYYQWENFANYTNTFAQKHTITAMVGMSFWETYSDNTSASSNGASILKSTEPNFRYINYLTEDAKKTVGNAPGSSASLSYFGRLIYSYDNRYSVQVNFRADAFDSSKLPSDKRWGYFPSVSAGWTVSNEPWFKNNVSVNSVSFLKLRASWGRNGNISVLNNYPYAATISLGNNFYQYGVVYDNGSNAVLSSSPNGLPNPNLTWETSEQLDLGLDARFLNNRLTFGIDYYNKQTKDWLIGITVPAELGVGSTTINAGKVYNKGIEVELGWRDNIGDFSYSINGNFAYNQNEVAELPAQVARITASDASSTNYQVQSAIEVGYPVWYMRGYQYAGLGSEGQPQYYNKDGKVVDNVVADDLKFLGQGTPKFNYGLNINLAWKGFDFALYGAGQGGNVIMPVLARTGFKNNLTWYLDQYKAGNTPNPAKTVGNYQYYSSDANLFKGDFFRIKQLQLGYTLPSQITKKAVISNLRFYVSLDDFFTFTSYPGLDPETASTNSTSGVGLDWGSYPTMQKLIFGVNLTF